MKLQFTLLAILLTFTLSSYAQSSEIACTSYKEIYKVGGNWGQWPNHWTTYASEQRNDPVIRITTLSEGPQGEFYRLQMFIDGIVEADFTVVYDPDETQRIRSQWNDQYVNCYIDESGDYVYTQKVSLQGLAQDSDAWATNDNSMLYLMIYSEDYSVALR